jgi:hypothetical protein
MSVRVIIDKIKQNFCMKKFIRNVIASDICIELNELCNLESSFFDTTSDIINNKFDSITEYISKKQIIYEINTILESYYRWFRYDEKTGNKLTARQMLSAWLIYYCPTIVLGEIDTTIKEDLHIYSNKIILEFINIYINHKIENIINFHKTIINYTNYINIFIENDKIDKLNYFTAEWISLQKSYDLIDKSIKYTELQKNLILRNIQKDRKMIEKYINRLFKNFNYDRLKIILNTSTTISKKIIDNYKNIIEKDIFEKKFEISIKVLNDIKKFILIFNKKNDNNYNDINEKIDGDYFVNLLKNNLININDGKQFGDYMINKLCEIGSIESEKENIIKWNEIKDKYITENDVIKLISEMMIFSLNLINIIRNEILDYEYLLKHILS